MMTQALQTEDDIYIAISMIKHLMNDLPFSESEAQCIFVSVMEITRNALIHGGGAGHFLCKKIDGGICFIVKDQGPGIPHLKAIWEGKYKSDSGLGLGLSGTKRLMDELHIETSEKGTKVIAIKRYIG